MAWTEQQEQTLRTLWSEGLPASAISERMGGVFGRNAVIGKAHRLGLEARLNPVDHDALFARICELVIDAPRGEPCTVARAARIVGMNEGVALRMWNARIIATHGGDPR